MANVEDRNDVEPRTYSFGGAVNGYFNGSDLRVTRDDGLVIWLNIKGNMWAVEVKDHTIRSKYPETVQKALDAMDESTSNAIYEAHQEDFWIAAKTAAHEDGLGEVYQLGRSGGWLAVTGASAGDWGSNAGLFVNPDQEEQRLRDKLLRFFFERVEDIEFHRGLFYEAILAEVAR